MYLHMYMQHELRAPSKKKKTVTAAVAHSVLPMDCSASATCSVYYLLRYEYETAFFLSHHLAHKTIKQLSK